VFAPTSAAETPIGWLDELNPEQLAATTAPADSPLLILAGAGSGKTLTLSSRVAWLVAHGVPAERILLLTFTRRAARAMLTRTKALLERAGVRSSGVVVGGTFHSVAWRLIRLYAEPLGLPPRLSVLDGCDTADLLDVIREELGYAQAGQRFPPKGTLADIYSRTVNARCPLDDTLAAQFPWCEPYRNGIAAIFRAYTSGKRQANLLDLDDLLLYWRALATHPTAGPVLADMFDHVLVDEYQDVNTLQVDIIRGLRQGDRAGLTVVGDDFQAIYGWRAASAEHILDFEALFPSAQRVILERNYRSTQPILDVANAVAAQAARGHRKSLRSVRPGGGRPELVLCRDETEEALAVVDRVLGHYERGVSLREQGVLIRAGHHSDLLELELGRRRIPFVKYGGIRYLEAAHVKDFVAAVRIVVNPADSISWFRVLQLLDGVGPRIARRILDRLSPVNASRGRPLTELWAQLDVPEKARADGDRLLAALDAARRTDAPHQQAEILVGGLKPLIARRYPDHEARLHDLGLLVGQAARAANLEAFVAELVLDPPSSSADFAGPPRLDEDYLVLSTIHSAKGLEWDAVHVIHVSDGNLPSDMALSTKEGLDEERRLLYVALTRARRELHVYVPVRYYHQPRGEKDANGLGKLSRFLTPDVQLRCEVVQPSSEPPTPVGVEIHDRVSSSVEELWR
jgi:DNA helicase-2/ATP-dependent DNA helicase PcrA